MAAAVTTEVCLPGIFSSLDQTVGLTAAAGIAESFWAFGLIRTKPSGEMNYPSQTPFEWSMDRIWDELALGCAWFPAPQGCLGLSVRAEWLGGSWE